MVLCAVLRGSEIKQAIGELFLCFDCESVLRRIRSGLGKIVTTTMLFFTSVLRPSRGG